MSDATCDVPAQRKGMSDATYDVPARRKGISDATYAFCFYEIQILYEAMA